LFFFFFQAEDGIRDIGVTGVQTLCSSDLVCQGHSKFEFIINGVRLFTQIVSCYIDKTKAYFIGFAAGDVVRTFLLSATCG